MPSISSQFTESISSASAFRLQAPQHLIWSKLNQNDIEYVRDRQVQLQPFIAATENFQINYLALVRLFDHPGLFVKYGQTDQMYQRYPTHANDFEEFMLFSIIDTHYNIQAERAFGKMLDVRKIRLQRKMTHNDRTYVELIPYEANTNLAVLELIYRQAVRETHVRMDRTKARLSPMVKAILGNNADEETSDAEPSASDNVLINRIDELMKHVEELKHSRNIEATAGPSENVDPTPEESPEDIYANYSRERKKRQKAKIPNKPVVARLHAKEVPKMVDIDENKGSVEKFIKRCCELGLDEKRDKWKKTEQFYEPQIPLYSVYKNFSDNPVSYADFEAILATYNIVLANRAYATFFEPDEKVNNKSKPSFVGIRLKNPPLTTLQRNIVLFLEDHTEIGDLDVAETPISTMFRAFNEAYRGWTSFYFNQELLAKGYTFGKHRTKGEKAWMGLRLKTSTDSSLE